MRPKNAFLGLAVGMLIGCMPTRADPTPSVIKPIEQGIREHLAQPRPDSYTAVATGFYYGHGDLVLTNAHAVAACREIGIENAAFGSIGATLLALDTRYDIAVLKADIVASSGFQISRAHQPFGSEVRLLSFDRLPSITALPIDTFATISPDPVGRRAIATLNTSIAVGQSGSPILDQHGEIIGMVIGYQDKSRIGAFVSHSAIWDLLDYLDLATTPPPSRFFVRPESAIAPDPEPKLPEAGIVDLEDAKTVSEDETSTSISEDSAAETVEPGSIDESSGEIEPPVYTRPEGSDYLLVVTCK